MENFNKKSIKLIINSDAAYEILDSSIANGSTWTSGGCAILAFALNITFGFPVYVIYNHTNKQVEHFGVKTPNNKFVDADGEQRDWLLNFRRGDFYLHPNYKLEIIPFSKNLNIEDIPIDMQASQKLAELFKPKPIANKLYTLHEGLFY